MNSRWNEERGGDHADPGLCPTDDSTAPGAVARALTGAPDRRTVLRSAAFLGAAVVGGFAAEPASLSWGVRTQHGVFRTPYRPGSEVHWRVAVPPRPRGVVLALHGKDSTSNVWFSRLGAANVARHTGLAVVAVDGGRTYWHPRSGSDAPAMIVHDVLPRVASLGLPTQRIGITGVSMGGFGALWLAGELGPERVFGVATMCAAVRRKYEDTSRAAFDDADDFARNSIFARVDRLTGIPVHLACGSADRFYDDNVALARRLTSVETTFDDGGHTTTYCRKHWPASMDWLSERA